MNVSSPVNIGSSKQLLLDDQLVERKEGFMLTVNPAVKMERPILLPEKTWEHNGIWCWLSVIDDDGVYKMWYDAVGEDGHHRLCYAFSLDGINWHRPKLGIIEYKGSRDNNIVFEGLPESRHHVGTVFKDPSAPEAERYKYIFGGRPDRRGHSIYGAYSSDGIKWKLCKEESIIPWYTDTMNVCFWDEGKEKYVAFVRLNEECRIRGQIRAIGRTESERFDDFPPPVKIMEPDSRDPPDMDLYNSAAVKYPYASDVYLMFPSAFYHKHDTLDVQLATSRDGVNFIRWRTPPFLRLGPAGSFDSMEVYMGVGMLKVGDELWMYYGGFNVGHSDTKPKPGLGGIGMARVRLDGFISQDASPSGGNLLTVPLKFKGERLFLNMDGSAGGWLKVEILDENGRPIKGFSEKDADPLFGNNTHKLVTWRGRCNVSSLRDRIIKLRFIGRNVKLYAFQFL